MKTHIGKIGRLSKDRREELGRRIEDSQPGTEIIHWLNALPDVQQVLAKYFEGRPILEQNLSDWKQSGHVDWVRRQEAQAATERLLESAADLDQMERASARQLMHSSEDLDEMPAERRLSDRYAVVMAAEMYRLGMAMLAEETDLAKRWQRLRELNRELSQLRRDDHRMAQIDLRRKQVDTELGRQADEDERREAQERRDRLTGAVTDMLRQELDEQIMGAKRTDLLYRIKYDLPITDFFDGTWEAKEAEAKAKAKAESEKRESGNGAATPVAPIPSPLGLVAPKHSEGGGERVRVRGARTSKGVKSKARVNNQTPAKPQQSRRIKPNKGRTNPNPKPRNSPAAESVVVEPQPGPAQTPTPQPEPKPDIGPATDPKQEAAHAQTNHDHELEAATDIPAINPMLEAYSALDRMNRGVIPYNEAELKRLYAAIPSQIPNA